MIASVDRSKSRSQPAASKLCRSGRRFPHRSSRFSPGQALPSAKNEGSNFLADFSRICGNFLRNCRTSLRLRSLICQQSAEGRPRTHTRSAGPPYMYWFRSSAQESPVQLTSAAGGPNYLFGSEHTFSIRIVQCTRRIMNFRSEFFCLKPMFRILADF